MSQKTAVSVVLATYQEYPNLKHLLPQLVSFFRKQKRVFQLVIVDDHSQDGTAKLVQKLQSDGVPLKFIERKKERGLASALIAGTRAATHPTIVRMDADLSHRVEDLKKLLGLYDQASPATVVVGSRFHPQSVYTGKPWLNQLASWSGRTVVRLLTGLPIEDTSNDFRIFPKKNWLRCLPRLRVSGNGMLIQELVEMWRQDLEFIEAPITYHERRFGNSKLNVMTETRRFFQLLPQLISR